MGTYSRYQLGCVSRIEGGLTPTHWAFKNPVPARFLFRTLHTVSLGIQEPAQSAHAVSYTHSWENQVFVLLTCMLFVVLVGFGGFCWGFFVFFAYVFLKRKNKINKQKIILYLLFAKHCPWPLGGKLLEYLMRDCSAGKLGVNCIGIILYKNNNKPMMQSAEDC